MNTLASGHSKYAAKIMSELVSPLASYEKTTENGNMGMLERNLANVAKDMQSAEQKLQKAEGGKSKSKISKVSEAQEDLRRARSKWDSESPNSFERLQQVDEARIAFLKDSLIRFQTTSAELYAQQIKLSEASTAGLLEINPNDEPMDFVTKRLSQSSTLASPSSARPSGLTRASSQGDSGSIRSSGGAASSLKSKFGTLLKGRRSGSPTKRQSMFPSGSVNSNLTRQTLPEMQEEPEPQAPTYNNGNANLQQSTSRATAPASIAVQGLSQPTLSSPVSPMGTTHDMSVMSFTSNNEESPVSPQQSFRGLNISDGAVQQGNTDEDSAAIDRVSSTLRSQSTISRKARGRREARNTVFGAPISEQEDSQAIVRDVLGTPLGQSNENGSSPNTPYFDFHQHAASAGQSIDRTQTASVFSFDGNESIRSTRSNPVRTSRHTEPTAEGLHLSVIETVNVLIGTNGNADDLTVSGEAAMASKGLVDDALLGLHIQSPDAFTKLIADDGLLNKTDGTVYNVSSASIPNMTVLFRYQLNPDVSRHGRFLPILMTQKWSPEPNQTSVKLMYRLNPAFGASTITLYDVEVSIAITGPALSCVAKPAGTFVKKSSKLIWRLHELTLESGMEAGLLARFKTEQTYGPVDRVELKFRTASSDIARGSGFAVMASKLKNNPFANAVTTDNVLVNSAYVVQSGRYSISTNQ